MKSMTIEKTIYCIIAVCYIVAIAAFLSPAITDDFAGFYCLLAATFLLVIPLVTGLLLPLVTSVVVCCALFLAYFVILSFGKAVSMSLVTFSAGADSQVGFLVACAAVIACCLLKTESRTVGTR
jgi:hypothetical protein